MASRIFTIGCLSMICSFVCAQNFYQTTTVHDVKLTFSSDDYDRILDSAKRAGNDARLTGTLVLDGKKIGSVNKAVNH